MLGLEADNWNENIRVAYCYTPGGNLTNMTLTLFPSRPSAREWLESAGETGWWMKITTDKGFAYTKTEASLRSGSSKLVNVGGFNAKSFDGTVLNIDEMIKSKTGITFELKKL